MNLRRVVVMRKDYPGLNMSESIKHRLSDDGLNVEDIVNIESSPMKSWTPGDFVIVWVRTKLYM